MVGIYVKVEELHSHVKLRTCLIRWRCGSVEWVLGESNSSQAEKKKMTKNIQNEYITKDEKVKKVDQEF